jgi:hypothetical protein
VISAVGVLAATVLLVGAVLQYRDGASALWVVLGALILLSAVLTLLGDVRHTRGASPLPRARRTTDEQDAIGD